MKWIVLLILSINIAIAQDVIVPKKIIDFCNEQSDRVDTLTKIVSQQQVIISNQETIINEDLTIFSKYKLDSAFAARQALKKDTVIINQKEVIKGKNKIIKNKTIIEWLLAAATIAALFL